MAPERAPNGEKGLFAALALALGVAGVLGAALFRSRKESFDSTAANPNSSRDNVLMFDEPVEQIQR